MTPQERQPRCPREGCYRRVSANKSHCSFICRAIDREIDGARRVCETIGNTPLTNELWIEVVGLSDAWTKVRDLDREIFRQAEAVGFTNQQWRAMKDGE